MEEKQAENQRIGKDSGCRIIFSDIDGTLLDSGHHVSPGTRKKIAELENKKIPFILVSARMPWAVRLIQKEAGLCGPIVCYSGGLIQDEKGEALKSSQIKLELAVEIKEFLQKAFPEICCNTYGMDQWAVDDGQNFRVRREEEIVEKKASVGDIKDIFGADGGIHKFLLMGNPEDIARGEQELKKRYPGLTIQKSNPYYLEVMDGSVTKSSGVLFLCRHLGISPEQAAAFGDGENDTDMLKAVKYGFAMGNASAKVKSQAAFVTLSNDEEGVLEAIKEL